VNTFAINLGSPGKESWHSASDQEILPHQLYSRPVPARLTDAMLREASKDLGVAAQWIQERVLHQNRYLKIVAQTIPDLVEGTKNLTPFVGALGMSKLLEY
jgi:hypothetical protein